MSRVENLSAVDNSCRVGFFTRLGSPFANCCRALVFLATLLFVGDSSAQFLAPTLVNAMPATGANNADFVLVIVDASDSMGRLLPQSNSTPRPTVLGAVRGALGANLLNPNHFPEFTWGGVQYLSGRRDGTDRSCHLTIPANAIGSVTIPVTTGASGNLCHLSTWTGSGPFNQPVSAGAFIGTNHFMDLLNPVPAQDYTNLGESLEWILGTQYGLDPDVVNGRNFRVLLITDGGESCHRQYEGNPMTAASTLDNSPFRYIRPYLVNPRLSLFITVVAPISSQDVTRMQQWVDVSNTTVKNNGLPSQIAVVGTEAELAAAMGTFKGMYINRGASNDAADPGAVGATGIDPRILHYNPCQSCGGAGSDSSARRCQCCLLAYNSRDCSQRCCSACLMNKNGGDQHFNTQDLYVCNAWADCDTSQHSPWNTTLENKCNGTRPALKECYNFFRGPGVPDLSMPNNPLDFQVTGSATRTLTNMCTYNVPFPAYPWCANNGVTNMSTNVCSVTAYYKSGGFPNCKTHSYCNDPAPYTVSGCTPQPCKWECVPQSDPAAPCVDTCVAQPCVPYSYEVDNSVNYDKSVEPCVGTSSRTFRQCCTSFTRYSCGQTGHPATCTCDTENCHPCRQNCAQESANLPGTYPVSYCNLIREDFCASIGVCSLNTSDYAFPRSFSGGTMPVAGCGPVPAYSMCPAVSPGLSSLVGYVQNTCGETVP